MRDERELNRRGLFKSFLAQIGDAVSEVLKHDSEPDNEGAPWYPRPPGSISEPDFSRLCDGCGECVKACPHQSILLRDEGRGNGEQLPFIDPQSKPCRLCPDLSCSLSCPQGAIRPLKDVREVRIGTAKIDKALCIAWGCMYCEMCVLQCPLSGIAITNEGSGGPVITEHCAGCGICLKACEAVNTVKAIEIIPIKPLREGAESH